MDNSKVVLGTEYDDSKEEVVLDITNLPSLKVEELKVNSRIISCVRPPVEDIFRGVILDHPIIDVIISDNYIEIRGLIIGKVYSGLILNLECIPGSKFYRLEDFLVKNGDIISEYICKTYKLAFKRDINEEEFNEWYFKLQQNVNYAHDFIKNIVYDKEFLENNNDFTEFINILYTLIYRKDISDDEILHFEELYSDEMKNNTFSNDIKLDIIDKMIYNKQFEYLVDMRGVSKE